MGQPDGERPQLPRAERKRLERERRFVDAAKKVVVDEGFEALTMQRLADHLDMAVSAVYRYFPSKGALVRQIQVESVQQLSASLAAVLEAFDDESELARLVLVGRWLCAASATYPEDLRLLQMIMARRTSTLDEDGGWEVLPVAMELVGRATVVVEAAQQAAVIGTGNAFDRALLWASALGGVLQLDDLEQYAPDLFGRTRLAQQTNLDLILGWGADPDQLERALGSVDRFAASAALAP